MLSVAMPRRFLTLCVNYRNDAETVAFVSAVAALPGYSGDIYVVSNSQSDTLAEELAKRPRGADGPHLFVDFPEENLGYFGGAARGLDSYLVDHTLPEWIMVANTDLSFPDPQFFTKLVSLHSAKPPAVVAPDIVLKTRRGLPSTLPHQNPFMVSRPPAAQLRFLRLISRWYPVYVLYELATTLRYAVATTFSRRQAAEQTVASQTRPIYAPFGACILFHRSYFEAGGSLKYPSFLFGEELFVAETAREKRLEVLYDPRLQIFHHEHGATGIVSSRRIAGYLSNSYAYLLDTYFK
jgi:GT2 family glycosyltransferase